MATLHIRNVPGEVVTALKARAAARGVSLNSEAVRALSEAAQRRTVDEILAGIAAVQARIKNASTTDEIVEGLRSSREERGDHVWKEATRPRRDR